MIRAATFALATLIAAPAFAGGHSKDIVDTAASTEGLAHWSRLFRLQAWWMF